MEKSYKEGSSIKIVIKRTMKKLLLILLLPAMVCAQQKVITPQKKITPQKLLDKKKDVDISKMFNAADLAKLGINLTRGYSIKGDIKGLKDSTLVFLTNSSGSTIAQNYAFKGLFELKGQFDNEGMYSLCFIGHKEELVVFIGNEDILVSGNATAIKKLVVKGSKMADDFAYYQKKFDGQINRLNQLVNLISSEKNDKKRDSLTGIYKNIVVAKADEFIKEKPASPIAAFILAGLMGLFPNTADLEKRFNKLSPEAQKGMYAELIRRKINDLKISVIGSQASDFTQNDTAGHPVSLSSFRGKYVLLEFWASWCKPCRIENPNIVAAYQKYKNKNFTIVGVSADQYKDNWIKAIDEDKLDWPQVSDLKFWENAVVQLYKIESIPQNILIGPDGKILLKNLQGDDLQTQLQKLLPQ